MYTLHVMRQRGGSIIGNYRFTCSVLVQSSYSDCTSLQIQCLHRKLYILFCNKQLLWANKYTKYEKKYI